MACTCTLHTNQEINYYFQTLPCKKVNRACASEHGPVIESLCKRLHWNHNI